MTRPILTAVLVLGACAAHLDRAEPVGHRFDGAYAGTVTEDPACGTEVRSISFQVAGSTVTTHGGHRKRRLAGSVSFDGQIDLQNASGGNPVIGSINNGTLIATETAANPAHRKHIRSALDDPMALPCIWRYEAPMVAGEH